MKKAKKILSSLLAFVFMLTFVCGINVMPAKAADTTTLIIHYFRADANYTPWELWLWDKDSKSTAAASVGADLVANGGEYKFNGDDKFGKTATYTFNGKISNIGFLVRDANWAKDCPDNRFVTKDNVNKDGKLEVWLKQGDPKVYATEPTLLPGMKAYLDGDNKVTVNLDKSFKFTGKNKEGFKVLENGVEEDPVDITSVKNLDKTADTKTVQITTAEPLPFDTYFKVAKAGYDPDMGGVTPRDVLSEAKYTYTKDDLGATYSKKSTTFKLWAPTASELKVLIYKSPTDQAPKSYQMNQGSKGVWYNTLKGDLNGKYYQYDISIVKNGSIIERKVNDPYAFGTSANSGLGLIYDHSQTNPAGWNKDTYVPLKKNVDEIIYETHVRDLSMDKSSGVNPKYAGKYLAFTQTGTKTAGGNATMLDHIKDLGVTAIHLMPTYDYGTGDETKEATTYNWGYDPVLWNNVEGTYSTNPNGTTRQKEYKQMVEAIHSKGIGVIADVVFNHTYLTGNDDPMSVLDTVVPGYYYRTNADGTASQGSGCGNDIASEKPMARKLILDSVKYWAKEYHIDSFRFDIMGLLDTETMKQVKAELKKINPNVMIYGEGWLMDSTALDGSKRLTQKNVAGTGIAAFNDSFRNEVKGGDGDLTKGFVEGSTPDMKSEIMGETNWTATPDESINYTGSHDGYILWDKIAKICKTDTQDQLVRRNNLANAILFTSQGVPFFCSGTEFGRTKATAADPKNSYNSVTGNNIDWSLLDTNKQMNDYAKGLIALRKAHPAFTMDDRKMIDASYEFAKTTPKGVVEYVIKNNANKDSWKNILVMYNNNTTDKTLKVTGNWNIVVNDKKAGTDTLSTAKDSITVPALSTIVAYTNDNYTLDENKDAEDTTAAATSTTAKRLVVKAGDITVKLTVPASTKDDDIYIVGSMNNWGGKPGTNDLDPATLADYKLAKQADGTYSIKGALTNGDQYKFVRGNTTWDSDQANADGTKADNQKWNGIDKEQSILIAKWEDIDGVATVADQKALDAAPATTTPAATGKVLVVKAGKVTLNLTVPASTGDDKIYIVGAFNNWAPDKGAELVKQADGTYKVDADITGEYKFVRGNSWDYVEKDKDGAELANNRKWDADTATQNLTVDNWADKL